ncbi:TetR/AcrR family transcriptional regulator [Microvirga sp. VF16]|uniref:TetR/AcrR family transcriptional regulator n=1 Tax=Microvirga sp. VF16 TaxID=2807101 RepID=UPI00193E8AEB|nr:TetR/AcrR family transcriptional regulator [Microvirga sp. VF16]QRM34345.1 TetR/AcrR family transcriptional regulator [Microvirga sp. VF16]
MNDTVNAIMDAAERRIREAGYGGFSFRDIAADVGVKSSSVHYHFPTKEALAAAVASRYTDRFTDAVGQQVADGDNPVEAWRKAFRRALRDDGSMCLCGSLAVMSRDLSREVASEVRRFFELGVENLVARGLTRERAMQVIATLEGAMLLANVLGDATAFDEATAALA